MNTKDLINLLRNTKDAPELGGGFDADQAWNVFASQYGFPEEVETRRYGWKEYVNYMSWHLSRAILRPIAVGFSAFAVVFGGWVATVNASFDSVPGDILYPVKLVTERVQLTFASSTERRVKLHAEFAGRRLDEVVEISHSDRDEKEVRVKAAVESFKQELAEANQQMAEVQSSSPAEATAIAIVLDQKTEEYEAVITQSQPAIPEESQEVVGEALAVVEEANSQAIDTLVGNHETSQETVTAEHLEKSFQEQFNDLKLRIALSLGRLEVVESALEESEVRDNSYEARVEEARDALSGHDDLLVDAMNIMAAGGYRRAFELLAEVDDQVRASEQIITELEISISTAIAAAGGSVAPVVPEELEITTPQF